MNEIKYRPDIDGLRAIAVLSVIIFHVNSAWLPSGYLGVDIFFVISGYLITLVIMKKIEKCEFSFLNFYKNRVKRIFPAFIFYIFIITILAYFFFTPSDFNNLYVRSLFSAVFFSSNIYFSLSDDYFSSNVYEKPLLHTWSLSLEEQFYLLFPFFIVAFCKFFPRKIKLSLVFLVVISWLCFFLPTLGLNKYYLPHLRAYELLIGSIASLFYFYTTKKIRIEFFYFFC